jgi:hypothetical protein
MGSEHRRRPAPARRARGPVRTLPAVVAALAAWLSAAPVAAAEPWWVPVGLRGQAVTRVEVGAAGVLAVAGGRAHCLLRSGTAATRAAPVPGAPGCGRLLDRPAAPSASGWTLRQGHVDRVRTRGAATRDPGSPDLGPSAHLLAVPAALDGAVVAVAGDGTVWRRTASGSWGRALLLLPQHLLAGPPPVTALAAFESSPVTPAVYLGTDGEAVLVTEDGGEDWLRAGAGLPLGVLALATDAGGRAVYAGTRDGLWVHHLRPLPAPPLYRPAGLMARWLEIAVVTLLAGGAAIAALARAAR